MTVCMLAQTGRRTTRGACCTLDTWHTPHVLMFRLKYSLTLSWYWNTKLDNSCYQKWEYSRHICLPCKVRLPVWPPGYNCWVCFRAFFLCPLSCFKHSPGEKLLHCIYIYIHYTAHGKLSAKTSPLALAAPKTGPKHRRAAERLPCCLLSNVGFGSGFVAFAINHLQINVCSTIVLSAQWIGWIGINLQDRAPYVVDKIQNNKILCFSS